jgi:pyrroloquinoline-quinone synthase
MTSEHILDELDRLVAERSILQHPFYRAWSEGRLTRDDLATYARVYYPHVAAFPGYLETAIDGAQDPAIRTELADNLREERGVPAAHPELWLRFAAAMGADPAAITGAVPIAETAATTATFGCLAARSTASAIAALYAYESQQPEVSRQKEHGLRAHYGVEDADALSYFSVHAEADVRHRDGERDALRRCLESGASRDEVLGAAGEALDAYWQLLDGVCREAKIEMAC